MRFLGFVFIFACILFNSVTALVQYPVDPNADASEPDYQWTIVPVLGYGESTSIFAGVTGIFKVKSDRWFGHDRFSVVAPTAIMSTKGQLLLSIPYRWHFPQWYGFSEGGVRYHNFPSTFYGLGSDSNTSSEAYTLSQFRLVSKYFRRLKTLGLSVGGQIDMEFYAVQDLESDGDLIGGSIGGIGSGSLIGVGPVLQYDTRDDEYLTKEGFFVEAGMMFYSEMLGSDAAMTDYKLDIRFYQPWGNQEEVLASQLIINQVTGASVFHRLPGLGGSFMMRGLPSGRYRDRVLVAAQTEWRLPNRLKISDLDVGVVVFAAAGNVFSEFGDLSFEDVKLSYGGGLRFPLYGTRHNLRFDLGFSKRSSGIALTVNEAF